MYIDENNLQFGTVSSFEMWNKMYRYSLAGMNIGVDHRLENSGELVLLKYLADFMDNNSVMFDVGANEGEYTLALRKVFPHVVIHSFEPLVGTYKKLQESTKNLEKVIINNLGISDISESRELYYDSEGSALASLYKRKLDHFGIEFKYSEKVELTTVDEYCEKNDITQIDFLKVDVEGNEYKVFSGAKRMINQGRIKHIQFEFGGCNIDSRTFLRDFWDLLSGKYNFYRIMRDGLMKIEKYTEAYECFLYQNFYLQLRIG